MSVSPRPSFDLTQAAEAFRTSLDENFLLLEVQCRFLSALHVPSSTAIVPYYYLIDINVKVLRFTITILSWVRVCDGLAFTCVTMLLLASGIPKWIVEAT